MTVQLGLKLNPEIVQNLHHHPPGTFQRDTPKNPLSPFLQEGGIKILMQSFVCQFKPTKQKSLNPNREHPFLERNIRWTPHKYENSSLSDKVQ